MTEQHKTGPWLILFRILFTAALIATIAFIFSNSLRNAELSSLQSGAALGRLNRLLAKLHLGELTQHQIRKLAHFLEYCLEGFWLMLCLRVYTARFVRHVSWPLLGGLFTALCDETLQLRSAGRSAQVTDIWIDFGGILAGLLCALAILLVVRGITMIWELKRENRLLRAQAAQRQEHDQRMGEPS